jgi:D-sedoheptulose 7-phosphate isomerase
MQSFFQKYQNNIKQQIDEINNSEISLIINEIDRCNEEGSTIYIIGNGGSAATASHMQNDLGSGLKSRGIINLNILSLCDNISVLSALANDNGFENVFYLQVLDRIKENDVLIAISASGNSSNIIKAVKYSRDIGAKIIGLTGFDGGLLRKLSDINYHIQTNAGEYGVVEDMHMMLDHMIFSYYIDKSN